MGKRLAYFVLLGTTFFFTVSCQTSDCFASTAATVEFNSLTLGQSEYTKRNVRDACYAYGTTQTLGDVGSLLECAYEAYDAGMSSFSYEDLMCEVSTFYVPPNTLNILQRAPANDTKEVFVAFPPPDSATLDSEQEDGPPSLEITAVEILSEFPMEVSVTAVMSGRPCLVQSLRYSMVSAWCRDTQTLDVDWDGNRTFSFVIENSFAGFCDLGDIYVVLEYKNPDGSLSEQRTYLKTIENAMSFNVTYDWLNLDSNPNGAELLVRVDIGEAILTGMNFTTQQSELGIVTDIGNQTSFELIYTVPVESDQHFYMIPLYGDFYGEFGCLVMYHDIARRSVCNFEFPEGNDTEVSDVVDDMFNVCTLSYFDSNSNMTSFEDAKNYCTVRTLQQQGTPFSLIKVDDEKSMEIMQHYLLDPDCKTVWSSYRKVNGTWQWEDGDTELNETLIDTSTFDPKESESAGDCTKFIQAPIPTDPPIIEQIPCSSAPDCVVCVVPLVGNVTDTGVRSVAAYN